MKSLKIWIYTILGIAACLVVMLGVSLLLFYQGGYTIEASNMVYLFILFLLVMVILLFGLFRLATTDEEKKKRTNTIAFPECVRIDKEMKEKSKRPYDHMSLYAFCEEFRNYAAGQLGLYYSIDDIRRFVAGLAVSHILILQGMSGTGKTSLAYAFGKFIEQDSTIIPIQPMWKERTDLLGYYNEFSKKFNETQFLQTVYKANWMDDMFITILDEMNIARVEYYFAEFLSLMEIPLESRFLDVISTSSKSDPIKMKNGTLRLPDNIWFIGTANNDDSTFSISDKVYDRAMVLNLDKKADIFSCTSYRNVHYSSSDFKRLADEAMNEYRLRYKYKNKLEHLDVYMQETFHMTFGNRINRQIEQYTSVYVACGGSELEALDDIISKKVFRKLVGSNSIYLKRKSQELCHKLDELFGEDTMVNCKEAVMKLVR